MSLNDGGPSSPGDGPGKTESATQGAKGTAGTLILRGAALQIVAFASNVLVSFFVMPILIHSLGERTYGLWALVGTLVDQLGFFDIGLMTTTERYMANSVARDDYETGNVIYSTSIAIFIFLGAAVFLAVGAIALATPLWLHDRYEIWSFELAFLISGLSLAWKFPFSVMRGALASAYRSDTLALVDVVTTIARGLFVIGAVMLGYGIVGISVAAFLATAVQRLLMGLSMKRYLPQIRFSRKNIKRDQAKELFMFSRFIVAMKLTDAARYRFHNLLIAPLAGIVAVTHYSVAVRLADYFEAMVVRVSTVFQPLYSRHFANDEAHELREKFLTISRLGSVMCCVFASAAFMFSGDFIRLWLGRGFEDSNRALTILVAGVFLALLQSPAREVLKVIYKHQFDAKTNILEVVCNLFLAVSLVPHYGIVGAAVATAIPMIGVKAVILPVYVCRTVGIPLWNYYRAIGAPFILTLVLYIPARLLPLSTIGSLSLLMSIGACYALILAIWLVMTLPANDKVTLAHAVGARKIARLPGGTVLLRALGV